MIQIYPAESRHSVNLGWLQGSFSFSFGEYYDPDNIEFGPLRVFNDDLIQPLKGFGIHPHRDMEIVTFVMKGQLKHEDNTGGKGVIKPGEIQRMSAGTGILHSEINPSKQEEANTLQLWFRPSETGLPPSYDQKAYDPKALKNTLLPVVSNQVSSEQILSIHQDVTIYLSRLESGKSLTFKQKKGRKTFLFVIEGELRLNQEWLLKRRDSARITEEPLLEIQSEGDLFFMLIDLTE